MGLPISYHKRKLNSISWVLRKLFINALFYTTKQLAKANCSVLQGGTRRKARDFIKRVLAIAYLYY
jgi:hypothetical protein